MIHDAKLWGLNLLNVSWGAAVLATDINAVVAILAGVTLIWVNIEKAINIRKKRKK
jgi:uncharacterized membrane protein